MHDASLRRFVAQLCGEMQAAVGSLEGPARTPGRLSAEVRFAAVEGPTGEWVFRPVSGTPGAAGLVGEAGVHLLRVEFESRPGPRPRLPEAAPAAGASAGDEVPSGGDPATLRRRLEILLGGPPGFNSGAKAGILADLLVEFGRPALLEVLHRDWIREFDTGADSSPSVTRPTDPDAPLSGAG